MEECVAAVMMLVVLAGEGDGVLVSGILGGVAVADFREACLTC